MVLFRVSIVLHKPRGYVCSHTRDEPESKIVFDLLPVSLKRIAKILHENKN
jgi:16S rRNA U516 pseudouridylate synthase RsuA-like enzyme